MKRYQRQIEVKLCSCRHIKIYLLVYIVESVVAIMEGMNSKYRKKVTSGQYWYLLNDHFARVFNEKMKLVKPWPRLYL